MVFNRRVQSSLETARAAETGENTAVVERAGVRDGDEWC